MANPFVGAVVDVGEERLPPLAKLGVVDRVAVVLGSDVALVRQAVHHRLWATEIPRIKDGREGREVAGWQGEARGVQREDAEANTH